MSDIELSNALLEEQEASEARRDAQTAWRHNPTRETAKELQDADELVRDAQSKLGVITHSDRRIS